jgi:hypothetical protein
MAFQTFFSTGLLVGAAASAFARVGIAQELEPRVFTASPTGTSFMFAGFGESEGAFVLDPGEPIRDAEADLDMLIVGGGHVFGLAGHQARVLARESSSRWG